MIDTHVHVFPDSIAERAVGKLAAGVSKKPFTNGTLSDTIEKMKGWGVDEFWIASIATNEKQMVNVNNFALSTKGENVFPLGSVYPTSELALSELERIYSLGIRGVKLHPEYQNFELSDRKVYPVYEFLQEKGMIVLFHSGKDAAYPFSYNASPKSMAKVISDFPSLKVIAAHFGGWSVWDEVYDYLAGKNIYFDTAYIAGMLDKSTAKKILIKHGAERIVFASDCPWSTPLNELDFIKSLGINGSDLDLIKDINAKNLKISAERGSLL